MLSRVPPAGFSLACQMERRGKSPQQKKKPRQESGRSLLRNKATTSLYFFQVKLEEIFKLLSSKDLKNLHRQNGCDPKVLRVPEAPHRQGQKSRSLTPQ